MYLPIVCKPYAACTARWTQFPGFAGEIITESKYVNIFRESKFCWSLKGPENDQKSNTGHGAVPEGHRPGGRRRQAVPALAQLLAPPCVPRSALPRPPPPCLWNTLHRLVVRYAIVRPPASLHSSHTSYFIQPAAHGHSLVLYQTVDRSRSSGLKMRGKEARPAHTRSCVRQAVPAHGSAAWRLRVVPRSAQG